MHIITFLLLSWLRLRLRPLHPQCYMGDLLQEVTPAKGTYNHRDGMTLEEAYEEYYGPSYSPKPFLDAVSKLVDAVGEVDSGLMGADPRQVDGS